VDTVQVLDACHVVTSRTQVVDEVTAGCRRSSSAGAVRG
jgi:hypothetical protein